MTYITNALKIDSGSVEVHVHKTLKYGCAHPT